MRPGLPHSPHVSVVSAAVAPHCVCRAFPCAVEAAGVLAGVPGTGTCPPPSRACSQANKLDIMTWLLGKGAGVNNATRRLDTSLHFVAAVGEAPAARLLVDAGAHVWLENRPALALHYTILHWLCAGSALALHCNAPWRRGALPPALPPTHTRLLLACVTRSRPAPLYPPRSPASLDKTAVELALDGKHLQLADYFVAAWHDADAKLTAASGKVGCSVPNCWCLKYEEVYAHRGRHNVCKCGHQMQQHEANPAKEKEYGVKAARRRKLYQIKIRNGLIDIKMCIPPMEQSLVVRREFPELSLDASPPLSPVARCPTLPPPLQHDRPPYRARLCIETSLLLALAPHGALACGASPP